jgi:hypothetical protein
MLKGTIDVIRLALVHDIRRNQRALDALKGGADATVKAGEVHRNAIADLRAALDDLELEEPRVEAVSALLGLLADWSDHGPQGHFTCLEADLFAEVLRAYGRSTSAVVFLGRHNEADADPSDIDHTDRRLLTRSA